MTSYATLTNESSSNTTATNSNENSTNSPSSGVVPPMADGNMHERSPPPPALPKTPVPALDDEFVLPPKYAAAGLPSLHDFNCSTTSSSIHNNLDYDYDSSSLSDGREKADTTPENLKKIDDDVEEAHQRHLAERCLESNGDDESFNRMTHHTVTPAQRQQQQQQQHQFAYDSAYGSSTPNSGSVIGLAAAIDDSNVKFCRAEKGLFSKADCIESSQNHNRSMTQKPVVVGGSGDYSALDSNTKPEDDDSSFSTSTNTTANTKQSLAFTIDSFNDKECDPAAAAAKYKSMMERFQSRHRRGASMSKLENKETLVNNAMTTSASASPLTLRNARNNNNNSSSSQQASVGGTPVETEKVKMRPRDRSTSRVRDASKRHSWSPRSSGQELSAAPNKPVSNRKTVSSGIAVAIPKNSNKPPQSTAAPKGSSNMVANRTQPFTPRSTTMQLALQKIDFMCPQPPLADFKHLQLNPDKLEGHAADFDNVSEAGTYTLDGDNYTEEQKDLMNIDAARRGNRPKHLLLNDELNTKIPLPTSPHKTACASNVLEVNYYHETPDEPQPDVKHKLKANSTDYLMDGHQSAGAYLEKIKSRVMRNMCSTKNAPQIIDDIPLAAHEEESPTTKEADMGCFTSVTTSGVLAKQGALDHRPKLSRRSSLSTSQIDSSEYISNEAKLKSSKASAYAAGGFTDHQKAEYRLNVFTNQKDSKFAATRNLIATPPETPTSSSTSASSKRTAPETTALKTAQTKNDWIQEWARNARARSLAAESKSVHQRHKMNDNELMTRSYTCASASEVGAADSLTDDSIYAATRINKSLAERYRLQGAEMDYSSDPALCSGNGSAYRLNQEYKPPKSPSKIPSPLHSIGRTRSASRTRASLQNMLGLEAEEDDEYLQKTAAAISNLQQSLSRKNSLKSPSHSNQSPRNRAALYSPPHMVGDCLSPEMSPHHHYHTPPHHQQSRRSQPPMHLMTSSINEQQLQLLTSGEYLARQMRNRKNSYDGGPMSPNSPARRGNAPAVVHYLPQTPPHDEELDERSLSPLRRSSSYSAKIQTKQRAARPQYQNLYTPPPARHAQYSLAAHAAHIKKSASSNNFGQVYSDYDEAMSYYINDQDDEYYSSGAEEDEATYYAQHEELVTPSSVAPPLSNTRCNKALLMRIERSKQKVATNSTTNKPHSAPAAKTNVCQNSSVIANAAAAGLIACPNTPELPRRGIKSAPSQQRVQTTARQSMPRDVSMNRLAQQVPNSLASAKKQLLQTALQPQQPQKSSGSSTPSNNTRVQPKYLDISKYKPAQGANFLRKNDAKSTLRSDSSMRRSPSTSSMGMSRGDATRVSNRSVRSASSAMNGGSQTNRTSSAVRRDASMVKQKEAEMAMWKRRSKYDPMKAAAEDRRRKEEAKRLSQVNRNSDNSSDYPCESTSNTTTTNAPTSTHQQQQISLEQQQQQWSPLDEYDDDDDEDDLDIGDDDEEEIEDEKF